MWALGALIAGEQGKVLALEAEQASAEYAYRAALAIADKATADLAGARKALKNLTVAAQAEAKSYRKTATVA